MLVTMQHRNNLERVKPFLGNMELVVSVLVPALAKYPVQFGRAELRSLLTTLQQFPAHFPEATQLQRLIAKRFKTPAKQTGVIQERLKVTLAEVSGWNRGRKYSAAVFDECLQFVKETLEAHSYEGYEPQWDQTIAELLFRMGSCLGAFEAGCAQDQRFDTIRALLSKMRSLERHHRSV
ncbi:hypothetical protein BBJ28_00007840 [Nothophytophthora sp. Chile5]|nr:hypothetical protein BBJ28_00007840 [Nothophytophthora sp. Chile5]